MTIIAGYFCLDESTSPPTTLASEIRAALRRVDDARGQIYSAKRSGFFVTKWDSGAFSEPAWSESAGGDVSTLAGDPLLSPSNERFPRSLQLDALNLFRPDADARLSTTRGSFSLLSYSASPKALRLATDVLGVRSIYYTVQNGVLIFASALRILETVPSIRRELSIVGTAEQCIYGQPLGARSPYKGIAILREAEVLDAGDGKIKVARYFDWSQPAPNSGNEDEAAARLYQNFLDGVRLRALSNERAFAFLSGGMDSRAIVATLLACGHPVVALNFSPDGSQDQDYAVRFTAAAGGDCELHCHPRDSDPNFSLLAYKSRSSLDKECLAAIPRPEVMWSGDGGSVGLGHVYMDERMIDLIERQGIEPAVEYFMALHRNYLPVGLLEAPWRDDLPDEIYRNVLAEVSRYPCADIGRQLYLFLLINDQRRHLYKHFESIDEHGLEFLTPFFDSVFLRSVAATPVRWGLMHRLYAKWFTHLPAFAQSTPWQTYPGHVECPVKCEKTLSYQWSKAAPTARPAMERLAQAWSLIKTSNTPLPSRLFSRTRTLALTALQLVGMHNCGHALHTIQTFQRIQARTNWN